MNLQNPDPLQIERFRSPHCLRAWLAAGMLAIVGLSTAGCFAQETLAEEPGAQVLTRGPVHEAFAGVISYDSVPGIVVTSAPPALIEEIPPGERPVGDDVTWIPGYWAWDDERSDFLWVSGIWRALPPGREWIVGYWADTTEGYQWTSGYWADAETTEISYLPAPPKSVEEGPNIEAPSRSHGWTPGCWIWSQERYAWSPGYWAEGRSDWDWIPAHYVWTRRGYVFVDGYWDHSVQQRGVLFAPVYFDRAAYSRPNYSYTPSVAINLATFAAHLFLRPRYDHYYFGDYYAPKYRESGYYTSYSYQSSRRGYDPVYAHQRWENRDDRDWERGVEREYQHRRDDESARPPHTWAAQRLMDGDTADVRKNRSMVATSFDQMSKRKDSSTRYQSVDSGDRQLLARRGQDVQKSREQRRAIESKDADGPREGGKTKVTKVPSSKSPIATKANKERKEMGAPPEPQRAPKSEPKSAPKSEPKDKPKQQPDRPSTSDRGKDKKADEPQAPKNKPQQPAPQRQPEQAAKEDKGKSKPQQPAPQRQPERAVKEDKGKSQHAAPKTPEKKPQSAPSPPKAERPAAKEKGKDKKDDEEPKNEKKKK